ncbi:MAG TPA: phosphoadenylyl-sulfate reductase [Devosia sp.]|nr:phosphoadenylyl-sulfate reductase [Devosia sp.]
MEMIEHSSHTDAARRAGGESWLAAFGIMALNSMFGQKDASGVLRMAIEDLLVDDLAVVSSFGADSAVLLHMVCAINPDLPVLFLQTGRHFDQTLAYVKTLSDRLGLTNVQTLVPDSDQLARFDPDADLWKSDPDSCCHIRKTEPLDKALSGFGGWVTGRKRHQTQERGVLSHFELTDDKRIKVNPLAYWDEEDVAAYKKVHNLPEHPLFGSGFTSIGCAPCTSAVTTGEGARAGRWRGLNKTECGIHFDVNKRISPAMAKAELTLFRDGRFVADPWGKWVEGPAPSEARYAHVPLAQFVANRTAYLAGPHPLGLLVGAGDNVEEVASDLSRFSSIAIEFRTFTDGRGYSSARLLVERMGYKGELRAVGDVLVDQIPLMRRCGINAFVVGHAATRKALEQGVQSAIDVFMQPVGVDEIPLGTRCFLRRANHSNS